MSPARSIGVGSKLRNPTTGGFSSRDLPFFVGPWVPKVFTIPIYASFFLWTCLKIVDLLSCCVNWKNDDKTHGVSRAPEKPTRLFCNYKASGWKAPPSKSSCFPLESVVFLVKKLSFPWTRQFSCFDSVRFSSPTPHHPPGPWCTTTWWKSWGSGRIPSRRSSPNSWPQVGKHSGSRIWKIYDIMYIVLNGYVCIYIVI